MDDSGEPYPLPEGCVLKQAAWRMSQTVFADPEILALLSPAQKGVLKLHEGIYAVAKKQGAKDSVTTRDLMFWLLVDFNQVLAKHPDWEDVLDISIPVAQIRSGLIIPGYGGSPFPSEDSDLGHVETVGGVTRYYWLVGTQLSADRYCQYRGHSGAYEFEVAPLPRSTEYEQNILYLLGADFRTKFTEQRYLGYKEEILKAVKCYTSEGY